MPTRLRRGDVERTYQHIADSGHQVLWNGDKAHRLVRNTR